MVCGVNCSGEQAHFIGRGRIVERSVYRCYVAAVGVRDAIGILGPTAGRRLVRKDIIDDRPPLGRLKPIIRLLEKIPGSLGREHRTDWQRDEEYCRYRHTAEASPGKTRAAVTNCQDGSHKVGYRE